jgi:hypothetical protein
LQKSLFIGLLAVLVLVVGTSASAANESTNKAPKTRTLTRFCVRYEFNHVKWTHGDLNAYRGNRRVCIVGKPGKNGKAGKAGASGAQGFSGVVGAQGLPGARGLAGFDGKNGIDGLPGLNGINGIDGATGPQGPQGVKGDTGAIGAQGAQGPQGAVGPAGAKGDTGAIGPSGPAGPKGDVGPAGPAGDTGPAGPAGPAGPQGPKGDAGFSGLITVAGGEASGDKQFTVNCPPNAEAISGGFNIQGSVTADFRSDSAGNPMGTTSWTVKQSSGNDLSGTVYVYCMAPATP